MNTPDEHDDFLRDALEDAVCDVEPTDRLVAIRARTAHHSRRGWYVAGTAALAAAAVVVAVAVVTTSDDTDGRPDIAAPTIPTTTPPDGSPIVDPPAETTPVYYVGKGSDGPDGKEFALYRYFEPAGDPLELLMSTPSDPDYRTLWPRGSLLSYQVTEDQIVVQTTNARTDDEVLARQQLVYTLQAALGVSFPVQVDPPGEAGSVIRPITKAPALDVLSHVNLSDPGERYAYGGAFTARGVGTGFEGTIACRLEGEDGAEVWSEATIAGAGDMMESWELEVDLTGVDPGGYVLICSTDDPTGGTEGLGSFTDNRTIYVVDAPAEPQSTPGSAGTTAYFVGPGPDGPDAPIDVLYRTTSTSDGSVLEAIEAGSTDPDYLTLWPAGSFASSSDPEAGMMFVALADASLRKRPPGMTSADAQLAVEQVLWSVQGLDRGEVAVQFTYRGNPIDQVYGVPTSEPLAPGAALTVLSHMIIDGPLEGSEQQDQFVANGSANSFEGSVFCQLLDGDAEPVWQDTTTSGGLDETLNPWELRVDLRGVRPGDYTLSCQTDDPTGGAEGRGADVDTRSITVTQT